MRLGAVLVGYRCADLYAQRPSSTPTELLMALTFVQYCSSTLC
jgi:hypothetical protein